MRKQSVKYGMLLVLVAMTAAFARFSAEPAAVVVQISGAPLSAGR